MKTQLNIFLILHFLFVKSFSQQGDIVSFEGGAVINSPLIKRERLQSHDQSTSTTDWTYKYYYSAGYYLKFSYEKQLFSKNKWAVFLPWGISYMTQVTKFHRQGGSWGCFNGESADELRTVKNVNVNLFLGVSMQYQDKKFRYSGSFILNHCFTVYSKAKATPYNSNDTYINAHPQVIYNLYESTQFCVLYNIKNKIWIGPTCEIFYTSLSYLFLDNLSRHNRNSYYEPSYEPSTNIYGKNIWINPGIKLQIDL